MTYNDAIARQNLLVNILLKNDDSELSKELKVKIIKYRIEFNKIRAEWDNYLQTVANELTTDEYKELVNIPDSERTPEQTEQFNKLDKEINTEFEACITSKANEEVNVNFEPFTEEEFAEIIEVNADHDVVINKTNISGPDFVEAIYGILVNN